ncbi:TetR/AcrR family transcriptional regulator [Nigerium massiliense]|uniref:TetR/AcrR family transcriptional regulator n=1 Tax=Nigerium massiliense TaxID=1522317 RepID=UPI000AC15F67|nr:TetR/AcrR family transcriptional regulator [Nigerium massiliense]
MTDARPGRLGPKRRQEILETVASLVIGEGYDAVTMDQIAAATKSSKATLYRQWKDKPTLVVAGLTERGGLDIGEVDTGSFRTDLERVVEMVADRADQNIAITLALLDASRRDPALRSVLDEVVLGLLHSLDAIAARAIRRGEAINRVAVRYLPDLFVGALFTPSILGRESAVGERELMGFLRDIVLPVTSLEAPGSADPLVDHGRAH